MNVAKGTVSTDMEGTSSLTDQSMKVTGKKEKDMEKELILFPMVAHT